MQAVNRQTRCVTHTSLTVFGLKITMYLIITTRQTFQKPLLTLQGKKLGLKLRTRIITKKPYDMSRDYTFTPKTLRYCKGPSIVTQLNPKQN